MRMLSNGLRIEARNGDLVYTLKFNTLTDLVVFVMGMHAYTEYVIDCMKMLAEDTRD